MKKRLLACLLFALFLTSCSTERSGSCFAFDSSDEKDRVEKFLRYLLFWERGVYTLLGSKPITTFDIYDVDYTVDLPVDLSQYADLKVYINKDCKEDLRYYKSLEGQEKKKAIVLSDQDYVLNGMPLMSVWDRFSSKIQISPNYLLIKQKFSDEEVKDLAPNCKTAYHILFVNVLKTVCLLTEHHELFSNKLGENFDPLEEVLKINDPDSSLWKCLFPSDPTKYYQEIGMLLGFGREDAQIFHWKNSQSNSYARFFFQDIYETSTDDLNKVFQNPYPLSVKNFPLPIFMSYFLLDPVKQKYERERKEIMDFYSDKDFLEFTLKLLTNTP